MGQGRADKSRAITRVRQPPGAPAGWAFISEPDGAIRHLSMPEIFGNTAGLSPAGTRSLERVLRRRVPLSDITTPELTRSLCDASRETKRQVGALVHRSGSIEWVVVGSATGLMLPDVGACALRKADFAACALVHTHLYGEALTHDDLVDLTRLRLDLVCALQLTPAFEPRGITWAHNIPERETLEDAETSKPYDAIGPFPIGRPLPDLARSSIRSRKNSRAKRECVASNNNAPCWCTLPCAKGRRVLPKPAPVCASSKVWPRPRA